MALIFFAIFCTWTCFCTLYLAVALRQGTAPLYVTGYIDVLSKFKPGFTVITTHMIMISLQSVLPNSLHGAPQTAK